MERNYLSRERHREDNFGFEGHHICGWPARIYACSFCRREFRSAQALGGHMNVHRRDRARLRSALPSSSCLPESPKPKPKPNPNSALLSSPSSSSSSSPLSDEVFPSALCSPCLTLSSTPSSATSEGKKPIPSSSQKLPLLNHQTKETKNTRRDFGIEELKGFAEEEQNMVSKNCDNRITLELGIGLLQHPKDNIDLELRLGHF